MTAAFFLADAHLLSGNLEQSNRYSASFLSQSQIPTAYLIHARAIQAASNYRAGKQQEALSTWTELFDQAAVRPELQAEILNACVLARANCAKFEQLAVAATEAGEGKKFFPLNAALGKYFLARKNYPKAVLHMEAGRDKANKNKIEVNDPTMLAMLAQAYFYNKKFSESLEIYFEMSKQYPAIRQIQDSLQGIYSIEQKSAGDVKIF
jgi:tetratricopeptide (TPR) repeat protein